MKRIAKMQGPFGAKERAYVLFGDAGRTMRAIGGQRSGDGGMGATFHYQHAVGTGLLGRGQGSAPAKEGGASGWKLAASCRLRGRLRLGHRFDLGGCLSIESGRCAAFRERSGEQGEPKRVGPADKILARRIAAAVLPALNGAAIDAEAVRELLLGQLRGTPTAQERDMHGDEARAPRVISADHAAAPFGACIS
ncbi:hypothetical protein GGR05_003874 [Aureimonas phyllosphaerae]|uniref:Uncharacterized protein n=1 Tax=Aureimonas phyllosphaerae TaxID=1166078 RepID=A0A7W6C1H0_9HYPH|nr:hypothetical protein [Aureimonas phyllosphaerae]MBB3937706.1 hypothetical protein [Aureimonas phyllosphaerae]MBB3961759.1 hypothetical protein [Aureimonas phyllosphaerae]